MSYILYKNVDFGIAHSGLSNVSFTLYNSDGTVNGVAYSGISECGVNTGIYGTGVLFPSLFTGEIRWYNGVDIYAVEDINPQTAEYLDVAVSTRMHDDGIVASGVVGVVYSNSDFTLVSSDLSSNNDDYNGMWLVFTGGYNKYIPRLIGDYIGAAKQVQFSGNNLKATFPQTVVAGDPWKMLAGGW